MPGFAHVIRLGAREGTYGKIFGEYQFTYSEGGKAWVRVFDSEASLSEFLRSDAALAPDVVGGAIDQLLRAGNVTIADVEIKESDAAAMGLEQLPGDY